MATITIEIDIDADGNPTVMPNPARVANGDDVKFHVRSNSHGEGTLAVTFPGGPDSPFGNLNPQINKLAEASPPVPCRTLIPTPNPASWPKRVKRYTYRVSFQASPLVTIDGTLEKADPRNKSDRTTDTCCEDIVTTMQGEYQYATEKENTPCAPPKPKHKAEADANARDNLKEYGTTWCAKGTCSNGSDCKPLLSEIRNVSYTIESRPASKGFIHCFVIATISGKVSCRCER